MTSRLKLLTSNLQNFENLLDPNKYYILSIRHKISISRIQATSYHLQKLCLKCLHQTKKNEFIFNRNFQLEVLWLLPCCKSVLRRQRDRSKTSETEWLIHNSWLHSANSEYLLILSHSLLCWIRPTDIMRKSQVLGSGWLNWWPEARKLGDYGWAIIITTYGLPESWSAAPAGAYLHTG